MYLLVVDQSKPCAQIYLHKFATIPIVFFKPITSDMHHHKTYLFINFQQNRVCIDQSKRARKFICKKNASCINLQLPIVIYKNRLFKTCIIIKRTCISIFSKLGLVDQSKPCTQIYLQKVASCLNLPLPIVILKKSIILDMRHRKTYMYINF